MLAVLRISGAFGGAERERSDEVVRFLETVQSLKARTALTTPYAAGLRASEAVDLKAGEIDSGRMVIRVEHGKGGKDVYVMLSAQLLGILRTYWRLARPKYWLFPGRDERKPIDVEALHAACRSDCAAGLAKHVTVDLPPDIHVHRIDGLGSQVLIGGTWYQSVLRQSGSRLAEIDKISGLCGWLYFQ